MSSTWFFTSWASIGRIALLATIVYVVLVFALRLVGERSLAKMSGYDLVITIALGSLIATIPLQKTISVADGFAAIVTFLLLQHVISWLLARWPPSRQVVKGKPTLVVWQGRILHDQLMKVSVTDSEVRAAIRSGGHASVSDVLALVLENDGNWSVISRGNNGDMSALEGIDRPDSVAGTWLSRKP